MPYSTFLKFVNQRSILPKDEVEAMLAKLNVIEVKKGHFLLKEGLIPHHIWFIVSGSLRTYYYHNDKEITSWIYNENQMVTAFGSYFSQMPSYEFIQTTEDCQLVSISYDALQQLYKEHHKIEFFGRKIMEEIISTLDGFYKGFMFMSASEKYQLILNVFPDITQRVNLGYIASFLGISQETLSRIRRKQVNSTT